MEQKTSCTAPNRFVGLFAALASCGSEDSELITAITDCQLDAHREIVETKN